MSDVRSDSERLTFGLDLKSEGSSGDSKDFSSIDSTKDLELKLQAKTVSKGAKPKIISKPRIIPSRYMQAAADSSRKNLLNTTLSGSSRLAPFDCLKGKSSGNNSGSSKGALPTKGSAFKNEAKPLPVVKTKKCFGAPSPRLHSTALNNTTFFDKTHFEYADEFSTTIVGEKGPMLNLGPLSDISVICPATVQKKHKIKEAVESASTASDKSEETSRDITFEEIKAEYLRFITWAYIDTSSQAAFEKKLDDAERQILFLTKVIGEEEETLSEDKEVAHLLEQYEKICFNHHLMEEQLLELNEGVSPCEDRMKSLNNCLEAQMNRIKLDNIHIQDEGTLRVDLQKTLEGNLETLQALNSDLSLHTNLMESANDLNTVLLQDLKSVESCLEQRERAAILTIQESSLKLSLT